MAKKQNPYHLWLGLKPELSNPNLFQILGVDPRSKDNDAIKKKATARANALLRRLKVAEVNSDAEKTLKKKMHAEIVLAHKTLVSTTKRQQYLKTLLVNKGKGKPAKQTTESPPRANATAAGQPPQSLPAVPPLGRKQDAPSALKSSPPPPMATAKKIPTAIPMAMPLTPPVDSVSPPAESKSADDITNFSWQIEDAAPAASSEPNFDRLESEPIIRVYPKKRRTSRSWLVPIVVLILIVTGIGGLVTLLTKYSNVFVLIPELKDKLENVAQSKQGPSATDPPETYPSSNIGRTASANDDENDPSAGSATLTVPDWPKHAIEYNGNEVPDGRVLEGGTNPQLRPQTGGSNAKPINETSADQGSNDRSLHRDLDKLNAGRSNNLVTLSDDQLTVLRLALHRSRDALGAQETRMARRFLNDAQKMADEFQARAPEQINSPQRGLIRAAREGAQIIDWVDEFWKQVKSAAVEMAGGQEIVLGDKTMGLVEGRDSAVVLRIAGRNETLRYRELTPMLAIAIGDMGSVKSIPRWNLAKSAYLGVMADQYEGLLDTQTRFINQSMSDGFDLESATIARYSKPNWLELGLPKQKLEGISESQFDEMVTEIRRPLNYTDTEKVPVYSVDKIINQLVYTPCEDFTTRVARLWEAVALAKYGGRTFDLMFINRELDACCDEVDFKRSFLDPMLHIAEEKKDVKSQNQIARQVIAFVKRFDGNSNLRYELRNELIELVQKIATELSSNQLSAMAQQLASASG